MAMVQAVAIGVVALILAPHYLFYFDVTPKLAALLIGAAASVLLWRGGRPSRSFTVVTLGAALSLTVSAALSANPALAAFGSTWRRLGLAAYLAILLFAWLLAGTEERGRITVLRAIALASAMSALYGIGQYFGWDPVLGPAGYHIGEGVWTIVRPPGTMGYVSYFATWLLMSGFLSLSLANSETEPRWRWTAYACAGLCFSAMLLTGTRAALAGLGAGLAVTLARRGFDRLTRVAAAAAGICILAGAFYLSPLGWPLRSRTRWFVEDPWGGARPLLWRDSLRMGVSRPVAGFGAEVFSAEFPRFESRDLARAYPDFAHESPHNLFLDALVSQGLPGLVFLVTFCVLAFREAWRARRPWMLAALAGGIVAQQFTAFTVPTALLFYATVSLCETPNSIQTVRRFWPARLAAASLLLYCAVRYMAADRSLELARQAIVAQDVYGSAVRYRTYERWRLPGASADLWHSRALLSIHAVIPAGQAALAAVHSAEEPFNAWYNLAEIYAIGNSAAETEACLRRAIAARPHWFKPHWMLAELLRLERRPAEAASEAAIAADLDAGKDPEVTRTLAQIRGMPK